MGTTISDYHFIRKQCFDVNASLALRAENNKAVWVMINELGNNVLSKLKVPYQMIAEENFEIIPTLQDVLLAFVVNLRKQYEKRQEYLDDRKIDQEVLGILKVWEPHQKDLYRQPPHVLKYLVQKFI